MKIAYFDCFSGVSGDMVLGALIDAGADFEALKKILSTIPVSGYVLSAEKVLKNGIAGTRFTVTASGSEKERHLSDILTLIGASSLPERAKQWAGDIFRLIGGVEAEIHGKSIEEIHFHEIGAVDSIIDIAGACAALDMMGIDAVHCSRINVGGGIVKTGHGMLPVPAPATAKLLAGSPVYSSGLEAELATPTGAAIMKYFSKSFGPLPDMTVRNVGYGAGMMDLPVPNLLRVYIGEDSAREGYDTVLSLETNIDDMNPEFYQHVFDRLFEAGALDVFTAPIIMKKGRPGTLLTVLAREERREALAEIIFAETTTAGIRAARLERTVLDREMRRVTTRFGEITVKVLSRGGRVVSVSPEYEECRRIAKERQVPLKEVYDEAKKTAAALMAE
ncbi:MAG TPA: nickel pincer cofactor biosynthesis protein LarC [Spirochaetota bacterium]|nr:nickel pincer cofactor biosynthesis protein LarC [Spirochaetota bacterium]HPV42725.1 nickel pincer cofactor biosynthesis protein LarC [Spirochaetota bacterium]